MSLRLEEIIREVVDEAVREYEKMIDQALEEGLSRLRKHREEVSERVRNELSMISREARISSVKMVSQAEMEAKKKYLNAIEEIVRSVVEESFKRIEQIKDTEKYERALESLIRGAVEALGGKKFKVSCSDEDREMVSRISARIGKELGVEISLEPEPIKTVGGVRVKNEDGSAMLDNTVEARLERMRSEIRVMIIKHLLPYDYYSGKAAT